MIPKEKAEKLFNKMLSKNPNRQDGVSKIDVIQAKQCALIAVDEILHALSYKVSTNFEEIQYYVEVKQEIENL